MVVVVVVVVVMTVIVTSNSVELCSSTASCKLRTIPKPLVEL